jgi:hypothetical protein
MLWNSYLLFGRFVEILLLKAGFGAELSEIIHPVQGKNPFFSFISGMVRTGLIFMTMDVGTTPVPILSC